MITKGPLNQLFVTYLSTPGSFLELSGLEGTLYTNEDVPKEIEHTILPIKEFRSRFNLSEMQAILATTESNSNIKLLIFKLQTASEISLEDPDVINGVLYLKSIGLLTPERSLEILKKY